VRYTQLHYPLGLVEPRIAEREFGRLIAGEKNITVLLRHDPVAARREARCCARSRCASTANEGPQRERGDVRRRHLRGDLAALAKVPYRVGREARAEYHEPHAGVVFANIAPGRAPADAVAHRLNIHPYSSKQGTLDPTSPFTAMARCRPITCARW